jgi:hypothetical protein
VLWRDKETKLILSIFVSVLYTGLFVNLLIFYCYFFIKEKNVTTLTNNLATLFLFWVDIIVRGVHVNAVIWWIRKIWIFLGVCKNPHNCLAPSWNQRFGRFITLLCRYRLDFVPHVHGGAGCGLGFWNIPRTHPAWKNPKI